MRPLVAARTREPYSVPGDRDYTSFDAHLIWRALLVHARSCLLTAIPTRLLRAAGAHVLACTECPASGRRRAGGFPAVRILHVLSHDGSGEATARG